MRNALIGFTVLAALLATACGPVGRGNDLLEEGQFALALAEFEAALAEEPGNAAAQIGRGDALLGLAMLAEAADSYGLVLANAEADDAQRSSALARRGRARSLMRDYEAAFTDYAAALELRADSWEALYNRAHTHLMRLNYAEAEADFTLAIEADPSEGRAYFFRGEARYGLEQYDAGDADFDRACELKFSVYDLDCAS